MRKWFFFGSVISLGFCRVMSCVICTSTFYVSTPRDWNPNLHLQLKPLEVSYRNICRVCLFVGNLAHACTINPTLVWLYSISQERYSEKYFHCYLVLPVGHFFPLLKNLPTWKQPLHTTPPQPQPHQHHPAFTSGTVGLDASLVELSCLITDCGAPRQNVHVDTGGWKTACAPLLTVFVALQDIQEAMGPTQVLLGLGK